MPPPYLVYTQLFDPVQSNRAANSQTGLFRLKRAIRNGVQRLGTVIDAGRIRAAVDVSPRFGEKVPDCMTFLNAMEISKQFNLNKYVDKETFELLHTC